MNANGVLVFMIKNAKIYCFSLALGLVAALTATNSLASHYYAGVLTGYGNTNWSRITTNNDFLTVSLPSSSNGEGVTWGVFVGDDFSEHFGAELRFQHFADTRVDFAEFNNYATPAADGIAPAFNMTSVTTSIQLLSRMRVAINHAKTLQAYSVLGASATHRSDVLRHGTGIGGVFGAGMQYQMSQHLASSLEFNFVTGSASVDLKPAQTYIPFLTSCVYKVSYYF